MLIPEPVQRLIDAFSRLPGVGPKTASRLTFYLLRGSEDLAFDLSEALAELKANTGYCQQCFNITTADRTLCEIRGHTGRSSALICVVEEPLDVLALERTGGFEGQYQNPGIICITRHLDNFSRRFMTVTVAAITIDEALDFSAHRRRYDLNLDPVVLRTRLRHINDRRLPLARDGDLFHG